MEKAVQTLKTTPKDELQTTLNVKPQTLIQTLRALNHLLCADTGAEGAEGVARVALARGRVAEIVGRHRLEAAQNGHGAEALLLLLEPKNLRTV